jgi:hypothetical protein
MYAIVQIDENGDLFYLNHACMNTLSFGSEDMAWTTVDREKAQLMAEKCEQRGCCFNAGCTIDVEEI